MFGFNRNRCRETKYLEPTDHEDIKIMRFGLTGQTVGPELHDLERLWDAIGVIGGHCAKVLVITVAPGHLSPENLDRFWERERRLMRDRGLEEWGSSWFVAELAREDNAFRRFIDAVRATNTFVIAAFGGEVDLHLFGTALACDYRLASDDLTIVNRTMQMGVAPGTAVPWFLTHYLGHGRAKQLLWQKEAIGINQAYDLNLVDAIASTDSLEASALAIAQEFCAIPDRELAAFKRAMVAADGDLATYFKQVGSGFRFFEILEHAKR